MTTKVEAVRPGDDLRATARRLVERRLKRLPVIEDGRLVGIVSRTDLLRVLHRSNEDLARDVAEMLTDPMRAPGGHEVEATVADGIVKLRGTVRFPADLPVLSSMVWQRPGVVDVRNEAIAREPVPRV